MTRRRPLPDPPTSFPAAWTETYAERHKNDAPPPTEHEWHKTLTTPVLASTSTEGLRRRLDWMAAQPEASHIGRNGRRLREQYKDQLSE